jgi:alpha-tubulin suppressor-like RCC1 family protein
VTELASGREHACALLEVGEVWCRGANDRGQLGDGTTQSRTSAVKVSLDASAVAIDVGGSHACALTFDQRLACWGSNGGFQLGDMVPEARNLPAAPVEGLSGVCSLALGMFYNQWC